MRVVSGGAGDAAGCGLSSDTCFPFGQFLVRRFDVQLGRGELLVINLAPSSSPTCELALISLPCFHRWQMLAGVSGFRAAPPGHVASPRRAKRGWHLKHGTAHNKEWAEGRRVAEAEPHQHQFGGCELLPPSASCDVSAGGDSRLHEPIPPGCLPQSFPKHSSRCCRTGLRPQAFHCFQGHSLCSGAEKQNCLSFTVYVYQIHAARFFFFHLDPFSVLS